MGAHHLKDPDAMLDFAVDWADWLMDGDTITDSQWLSPDGLLTTEPTLDGTRATVWLSGGEAGRTYRVTNRVTTFGGRVDDRTLHVHVLDR